MITDSLMDSRSPTQQRGESPLSGGIIHETICDASGKEFKIKILFTLVGEDIVTDLDFKVLGKHEIPAKHLIEIIQDIIEKHQGHVLKFQ